MKIKKVPVNVDDSWVIKFFVVKSRKQKSTLYYTRRKEGKNNHIICKNCPVTVHHFNRDNKQ